MTLKLGLVGIGNVAVQNYIPFLATQPDVSLGYYNRTTDKAQQAAVEHGGQVFESIDQMMAWEPDSVLILTSEKARYEVGMQVIEAGAKRVFFEKPLVAMQGHAHVCEHDFQQAKALLDTARQRQCQTAMIFNYRFFDQTIAAKKIVDQRDFGKVIHVAGMTHYACWCHCIDLIHHFGGPVAQITALSGTVVRQGQGVEATDVTAAMRLENGATGTLMGTAGLQWHHPLYELMFAFERGRIHLRDLDGEMEVYDASTRQQERYTMVRDGSRWTHYSDSFAKSVGAYLKTLREGCQPPIPGVEGLRELQVEAALRRSIAQQRPVMVQKEFPLS